MMRFVTKVAFALIASNFLPVAPDATATVVAAGKRFACTPVAVWDGDGPIWCAEGPKLRIAGVAAREIGNIGAHMEADVDHIINVCGRSDE